MKTITHLFLFLLILLSIQCDSSNPTQPINYVDVSSLSEPITSAYAIPMDSLQGIVNEIEAMIYIAESQKPLDILKSNINEAELKYRADILKLKEIPGIDDSNIKEIDRLLSKLDGDLKSNRASENKSADLATTCVLKYDDVYNFAKDRGYQEIEQMIHLAWLLNELTRMFKGEYLFPNWNAMQQKPEFKVDGVIKGTIAGVKASFDLDYTKNYILIFYTAGETAYYTYSNEAGITLAPHDPAPKRVFIYFDRLFEDRTLSEKSIYSHAVADQQRQKDALQEKTEILNDNSVKLTAFANSISSPDSPTSKIQQLKTKINALENEKANLEKSENQLQLEIRKLESLLK